MKTIPVSDLIRDAARLAPPDSGLQTMICESSIPDDCWPVEVNEAQIRDAIYKLVASATKAAPAGGVIKLCVENVHGARHNPAIQGRYIKMYVKDQGLGLVFAY
jgi:signal transduction histidine kinase